MLIFGDKYILEVHSSQPLQTKQTNNEQFKIAVTFLAGYNGIFNGTSKNNKFYSTRSSNDDQFSKNSTPICANEIESLHYEIEKFIIEKGYFRGAN